MTNTSETVARKLREAADLIEQHDPGAGKHCVRNPGSGGPVHGEHAQGDNPMTRLMPPATHAEIQDASRHLHTPSVDTGQAQTAVEGLILDRVRNQPRSLQTRIGPSEIGMHCDHCLAARLAGWEKQEQGIPWASTVGTAIHNLLEGFVTKAYAEHILTTPPGETATRFRYWAEQQVTVGTIGGQEITGSTDLLDVEAGMTIDWKAVSKTSLQRHKRGVSDQYRVQAHLYAKGWNDAGIRVDTVSICFLPRTTNSFHDRHWWHEPYNPKVALDALERANHLHNNLQALEAVSTEACDQWITSLPRAPNCWDCRRYADHDGTHTDQGVLIDTPNLKKQTQKETVK